MGLFCSKPEPEVDLTTSQFTVQLRKMNFGVIYNKNPMIPFIETVQIFSLGITTIKEKKEVFYNKSNEYIKKYIDDILHEYNISITDSRITIEQNFWLDFLIKEGYLIKIKNNDNKIIFVDATTTLPSYNDIASAPSK